MVKRIPWQGWVVAGGLGLLLCGCLGPRPGPPARFYQLQPGVRGSEDPLPAGRPAVGVGPVELAPYLDRPQMATRVGATEIRYDELHRWAEPLAKNINWVLAENLAGLLPDRSVRILDTRFAGGDAVQIAIRILRLDGVPGGAAALHATWSLTGPLPDGAPAGGSLRLDADVPGPGVSDVVETLGALLADLSRRIAEDLADRPEP